MLNKLSRKDIELLNILAQTPEGKSALDEYIEQHEKAVKAYKVYRESVVAEVEVEKVVKPVETKRKFKAGDKVRVLSEIGHTELGALKEGHLTEVVYYKDANEFLLPLRNPVGVRNLIGGVTHCDESELELTEEKTLNELRAEIIQRAKDFVDENKHTTVKIGHRCHSVSFGFVVNLEERRVTALSKGLVDIRVQLESIARCSPNDVFNEHIGKAIALGRALGKDVSEFENAVQPTKAVYGMIVERHREKGVYLKVSPVYVCNETCTIGSDTAKFGKIIDDTNAQYGGVE